MCRPNGVIRRRPYLQQRPLHNKHSHRPTHCPYNRHKNKHTSIVSRHLATRDNNKILRTTLPHISSSEETFPRLIPHIIAQLRTNKSPFLKSYLQKVGAKSHPSVLCALCNTHIHTTHIIYSTASAYVQRFYPEICGQTPAE